MYRDDRCATCGEALPPDHLYCRMHAAEVDGRLQDLAVRLQEMGREAQAIADLVDGIAPETWDYLAEAEPNDPEWPPAVAILLRLPPEQVDVDVDTEPGLVRIRLDIALADLLAGVADNLRTISTSRFQEALRHAHGAGATH